MVFKWRDSHIPLFLERYQTYECLWTTKSKSYKDRNQRDNAIRSLKEDLNIDGVTEEDIKLKIKNVRTRYNYELAKIKKSTKSGCSMDEVYVPKLFWFAQADTFLNAVCTTRESSSNLEIESNEEQQLKNANSDLYLQNNPVNAYNNGTLPREEVYAHSSNQQQQDNIEISGPSLQFSAVNTTPHATMSERSTPSTSQAPRHLKRGKKRSNEIPIDRAIKQLKEINDANNKEDEFDLFCRSLAVQLRAMPIQRALLCQEKLQSVMVQERLQSMIVHSPANSELMSSSRSTTSRLSDSELSYNIQSPPASNFQTNQQPSYTLQSASTNSRRSASETSNYIESSYIVQSPPETEIQQDQQTPYTVQLPAYSLTSEYEQAISTYENYQAAVVTEPNSQDLVQVAIRSITNSEKYNF